MSQIDFVPSTGNEAILSEQGNDPQTSMLADLQKLDLSLNESKVLLHLMIHKSSTATDISKQVGVSRTEVYNYLSNLLSKGIVMATFDRPQKYYALSYREVVDCLVQSKENTLHQIAKHKEQYQNVIDSIVSGIVTQGDDDRECYQVITGEDAIHAKVNRMVAETKDEILMLLSDRNFVSFYHAEIMDSMVNLTKKGVRVGLQTSYKEAEQYLGSKSCVSHVSPESVLVNFILSDGKQLIMLLEDRSQRSPRTYGFYTNNASLLSVFRFVFEKVQEKKKGRL